MKPITQVKIIAALIAMTLTFYPVFELSRCIISYDIIGGWEPGFQGFCLGDFYAELGLIWVGYIALPFAVSHIIGLAYRLGKKEGNK